jgi:hypothetical protein
MNRLMTAAVAAAAAAALIWPLASSGANSYDVQITDPATGQVFSFEGIQADSPDAAADEAWLRLRERASTEVSPATPAPVCSWGSFYWPNLAGACWRPYSDASPFNMPLPENPRLVSNSAAIVSRTVGFGNGMSWNSGDAGTTNDWDHPLYFNRSTDPLYTIHCVRYACPAMEGKQVRIPAQAKAAGVCVSVSNCVDGHMAVFDQATGLEWDFWQVYSKSASGGTLNVGSGGVFNALGDGRGASYAPRQPTGTAGHYGLAAGIIRPAELEAGLIDHALFLVVRCVRSGWVYPAEQDSASKCSDQTDAPILGARFYLDMSDAEINALGIAEWKRVVLRAIADYGMYVGDTGGPGFEIQPESGSSFTSFGGEDPWKVLGQQLGVPSYTSDGKTKYSFNIKGAVNWAGRLKVVDPCVSQRTC